jgi:group II intron reverse transcriptase/maturase
MTEPLRGNTAKAQDFGSVSTKQQWIAELAKERPQTAFTSLAHLIDLDWLKEAYRRTRKDGAIGVDGTTAEQYEANLERNLQSLLERAKSGRYQAPPVRRVHIPKGNGETRPLGIPTLEDKVLQRAVLMILEPLYETAFLDVSFGFRPGKSAHQALAALWKGVMGLGSVWIADVDLRKYFDTIDHGHLREFLKRRVRDGVLLRLIGKWLNAGVLEEGEVTYPEKGTPQGGVISPLLANIFLHYVLDEWFESEVKPRLRGVAFLIRYADDFLLVFAEEEDARRVMDVLPKRTAKYGLTIHPEKTRLVAFRPSEASDSQDGDGEPKAGTFDFLGFTHYWGRSRHGNWVVKRKTSQSRLSRGLRAVWDWCRDNRHRHLIVQYGKLCQKLKGHYAYYGITGNYPSLQAFLQGVKTAWRYWLSRRRRKGYMSWGEFLSLLTRYQLPPARVVHSAQRLAVKPS